MRLCAFALAFLLTGIPAFAADCFRTSIGLDPVPVTMTAGQWNAGVVASGSITPRLADGTPSPNGRTVFLCVGMSNTRNVCSGLRLALLEQNGVHPALVLVNGGQSGQAAREWANPACTCWPELTNILVGEGVTDAQVQAIYLMLVVKNTKITPQANAVVFADSVRATLALLEARFPNLQLIYLTNNYYGGYDDRQNKTPEPHGYYEGLTLQGLQDGHTGRTWVSAVSAYHWTDGIRPRWDGLTMLCPDDVTDGGVHLSNPTGRLKYGRRLRDALWNDPTTAYWLRQ